MKKIIIASLALSVATAGLFAADIAPAAPSLTIPSVNIPVNPTPPAAPAGGTHATTPTKSGKHKAKKHKKHQKKAEEKKPETK